MYMPKVAYGYVDEPDKATIENLGTYETRDEAVDAAQDKFREIVGVSVCDVCDDEVKGGRNECYVTYGYYDPNLGRVVADRYYYVSIIERHPNHILAEWLRTAATTSV